MALPGSTGTGSHQLARVLLVGGSTRMPVIGRMLRRVTGLPLSRIANDNVVHPDEVPS